VVLEKDFCDGRLRFCQRFEKWTAALGFEFRKGFFVFEKQKKKKGKNLGRAFWSKGNYELKLR